MWSVPSRRSDPSTAAPHVTGPAVEGADARFAFAVLDEAELGGDHDVVTAASDGLPDDLLAVEGPVDLSGVDVGDAQVQRATDRGDRLDVVQSALAGVGAGHGHGAQADARDLQA